jgi:DMSO/TMAO reductase YedYZ molybdopterin-dependent catalytic subunit
MGLRNSLYSSPSQFALAITDLDKFQGLQLYSSIDLFDAMHPQTILAWAMNGEMLPRRRGVWTNVAA